MSSPEIALPISSSRSENKTTCDFYVESIKFYTNPDQHGFGYDLGIKKSFQEGSSLGPGRYKLL